MHYYMQHESQTEIYFITRREIERKRAEHNPFCMSVKIWLEFHCADAKYRSPPTSDANNVIFSFFSSCEY